VRTLRHPDLQRRPPARPGRQNRTRQPVSRPARSTTSSSLVFNSSLQGRVCWGAFRIKLPAHPLPARRRPSAMLKTQVATAVLQRTTRLSSLAASPSPPSPSPATSSSYTTVVIHAPTSSSSPATARMTTTEGSVRTQHPHEAGPHATEDLRAQQRPQRPSAAYFPLGYKDAAYQWVRTSLTSTPISVVC